MFRPLASHKSALSTKLETPFLPASRLHPNLAEAYRQKVENLQNALAGPNLRGEAFDILRGLIEQVNVAGTESGGFEIEVVGEIARTVALAADPGKTKAAPGKEAAFSSEFASSVKVFVGARSRLYLLVTASHIPLATR